jgi:hypothetical protein
MPQQSSGRAVMRNGLIFGAIIAALIIGDTIVGWLTGAYDISSQTNGSISSVNLFISGVSALMGCAIFLGALALTFVAGMLTSRRTGGIGGGTLAGLVAGAFGALLGGAVSLIVTITLEAPGIQAPAGSDMTQSQMQGMLIGAQIFGLVAGLFQYGAFGAGAGVLGGLVGKNSYEKANAPAYQLPPFYYPGMPGQPGAYYPYAPYPGPQYPAPPYAPPPPYAGPQYPMQPYPGRLPGYPMPPAPPQEPPQG